MGRCIYLDPPRIPRSKGDFEKNLVPPLLRGVRGDRNSMQPHKKQDLRTRRQKPGFYINISRLKPRFSKKPGFFGLIPIKKAIPTSPHPLIFPSDFPHLTVVDTLTPAPLSSIPLVEESNQKHALIES